MNKITEREMQVFNMTMDGDSIKTICKSLNCSEAFVRDAFRDVMIKIRRGTYICEDQKKLPGIFYVIDGHISIIDIRKKGIQGQLREIVYRYQNACDAASKAFCETYFWEEKK